jgi:hypothetical protein
LGECAGTGFDHGVELGKLTVPGAWGRGRNMAETHEGMNMTGMNQTITGRDSAEPWAVGGQVGGGTLLLELDPESDGDGLDGWVVGSPVVLEPLMDDGKKFEDEDEDEDEEDDLDDEDGLDEDDIVEDEEDEFDEDDDFEDDDDEFFDDDVEDDDLEDDLDDDEDDDF